MKACIKTCRDFARKFKGRGRDVLRQEWHTYRRILHVRPERMWIPHKLKADRFYARIYREDEKSREDWTSICRRLPTVRPPVPPKPTTADDLNREFLLAVMEPNTHYRVSPPPPENIPPGGGEPEGGAQDTHFHLLGLSHGRSRPHTMHTIFTADDVCYNRDLAFHVEFFRAAVPPRGRPGGG